VLETPNHILMTKKQFLSAFCITIPKATFREPLTIHEWTHKMMMHSMKYVAMSRAKDTKNRENNLNPTQWRNCTDNSFMSHEPNSIWQCH
jgi:hypothetical protein